MMIYQFKPGAHLSGDAQAVGERLEVIRKRKSGLTPEAVLTDARKAESVLHPYFEWDDRKAANKYRIEQAGHIIRCVTVVIEDADPQQSLSVPTVEPRSTTVRAFMPVQREDGESVYESTASALSDAEYRRQILARAHGELGAVGRKYRELKELAEVIDAIDRVGELLQGERLPEQG